MNEEWRDVVGWEGMYKVSNCGRIFSLPRRDKRNRSWGGYYMSFTKNKYGYLTVNLTRDAKQKRYAVHRLVACAFLQNPNNYKEINHKDENKENNNLSNLEWCTRSYNVTYGRLDEKFRKHRVAGERCGRSKITLEQVNEIRAKYVRNSRKFGLPSLAKEYGISPSQVGNIVREKSWIPEYI